MDLCQLGMTKARLVHPWTKLVSGRKKKKDTEKTAHTFVHMTRTCSHRTEIVTSLQSET